ncbi:phosphate-starvation-inducible PsiE family protein [Desulfosporosinus fructosivorans]
MEAEERRLNFILKFIKKASSLLIWTEMILHLIVFMMLVVAAILIVVDSISNFHNSNFSLLTLINNALLLLIIKEIIWTVLRFFKQEKFSLSPFIYIGVISSVREILFLGIKNSIEKNVGLNLSLEILINAVVVFLLVLSYYLFKKARILAGQDS